MIEEKEESVGSPSSDEGNNGDEWRVDNFFSRTESNFSR